MGEDGLHLRCLHGRHARTVPPCARHLLVAYGRPLLRQLLRDWVRPALAVVHATGAGVKLLSCPEPLYTVQRCPAWVLNSASSQAFSARHLERSTASGSALTRPSGGVGVQVSGHHCVLPQAALAQVLPDAQMGGVRTGVLRRACRAGEVSPASDSTTFAAMRFRPLLAVQIEAFLCIPWQTVYPADFARVQSWNHVRWEIRQQLRLSSCICKGAVHRRYAFVGRGESMGWLVQGDPTEWVSSHRYHHLHTDTPLDPHSPYEGFWWSHMGWLLDEKVRRLHSVPPCGLSCVLVSHHT